MHQIKIIIAKSINVHNMAQSGKLALLLTPIIGMFAPVKHLFVPLIALSCLDILTGIVKNRVFKKQPISSKELMKRKPLVFLLWSLGLLTMLFCDIFLKEIKITGNWAAKLYCVFYGLYEVISILENVAEMGLPGANGILKLLKGKLPDNVANALEGDKNDKK